MPITLREPPKVGNESSRYFNNSNNMNRLATSTPSSFNNGTQQLYYEQPSRYNENNSHYNNNHIMTSPNSNTDSPKQAISNKNTSFY